MNPLLRRGVTEAEARAREQGRFQIGKAQVVAVHSITIQPSRTVITHVTQDVLVANGDQQYSVGSVEAQPQRHPTLAAATIAVAEGDEQSGVRPISQHPSGTVRHLRRRVLAGSSS